MTSLSTRTYLNLIQTWNSIELPASGLWRIHRSSFVSVTPYRHGAVRAPVFGGAVLIDDPVDVPLDLSLQTADARVARIEAAANTTGWDSHGFGHWSIDGVIESDDGSRSDIAGALRYHGVYRRGSEGWAWFTGTARTPATRRHRRRSLSVVFDLIAYPVDAAAGSSEIAA